MTAANSKEHNHRWILPALSQTTSSTDATDDVSTEYPYHESNSMDEERDDFEEYQSFPFLATPASHPYPLSEHFFQSISDSQGESSSSSMACWIKDNITSKLSSVVPVSSFTSFSGALSRLPCLSESCKTSMQNSRDRFMQGLAEEVANSPTAAAVLNTRKCSIGTPSQNSILRNLYLQENDDAVFMASILRQHNRDAATTSSRLNRTGKRHDQSHQGGITDKASIQGMLVELVPLRPLKSPCEVTELHNKECNGRGLIEDGFECVTNENLTPSNGQYGINIYYSQSNLENVPPAPLSLRRC